MQERGGARVGKGKEGWKGREGARRRKEEREGGEGKRGGKEREREGNTRHTNPSLLSAPLLTGALRIQIKTTN